MAENESVNDQIHDDLISHDIALRRIDGGARRNVERRLDRLGADLKSLTGRIDPFGTARSDARKRRLSRLEKESKELIDTAYAEIAAQNRDDLKRVARIETNVAVDTIAKALP